MKQIWFDVEQEHRRLYAVEKGDAGKWLFFFDRWQVVELTPWPLPIQRLDAAEVETFAKMDGAKGCYLILTKGGGAWGGHILRRNYTPAERKRIQVDSDEAERVTPAAATNCIPDVDLTPEIERDALAFLATWRPGWRTGATPGEVYRWHVRCGRKATATRGLLGISQRTLQNYVRDIEKALTTELGRKVDLSRFRKAKRQPVTRQIQKVYLSPDRKTTDRTARNPAGIAPQSDSATYATWRENMNEELKSRDDERDE